MNKKLFIFTIVLILISFISFVSAVSCNNPGLPNAQKLNQQTELIQTCDSCTYVNISSIITPNSVIYLNSAMTKNGTTYNYSYTPTQIGTYYYSVIGDKGGTLTEETLCFEVTADGQPFSKFPYQFFIIIIGVLFILFSYINERMSLFRYVGSVILTVMGVLTLYPGYSFINWTTLLGKTLGIGLIALGFYFMIEGAFSRDTQSEHYNQYHDERRTPESSDVEEYDEYEDEDYED